jgi:hypothetical protein
VAPPGCRFIPNESSSKEDLLGQGWTEQMIGLPNSKLGDVHNIPGSMRAIRYQYGLRHHIGATIHAVMGQTLASLLTRVEPGGKGEPYSLWLASQVVVLLSRTRFGRDTYIWCPQPSAASTSQAAERMAHAIFDLLQKTSPFRNHLSNLINAYCNQNPFEAYVVNQATSIFRVKDIVLPDDCTGYVYILVSLRDLRVTYIGSAENVGVRFERHNNGFGGQQTSNARYRPWGLLAFITGFNGNKEHYRNFEDSWIAAKLRYLADRRTVHSVEGILDLGKELVADYNRITILQELRFVDCGTITRTREQSNKTGETP